MVRELWDVFVLLVPVFFLLTLHKAGIARMRPLSSVT
jgi:hypothetical protein